MIRDAVQVTEGRDRSTVSICLPGCSRKTGGSLDPQNCAGVTFDPVSKTRCAVAMRRCFASASTVFAVYSGCYTICHACANAAARTGRPGGDEASSPTPPLASLCCQNRLEDNGRLKQAATGICRNWHGLFTTSCPARLTTSCPARLSLTRRTFTLASQLLCGCVPSPLQSNPAQTQPYTHRGAPGRASFYTHISRG